MAMTDKIEASRRPLETVAPATLRELYEWWNRARGDRPWLPHAELRPWEFAAALPHIALVDRPSAERPGLYLRLVGEEIRNDRFGYIRGKLVENLAEVEWYRDHLVTRYYAAFAEAAPSFEVVRVFHEHKRIYYNRLILPLTTGGGDVDMLMVATVNVNPPDTWLDPEDHLA